MFQLTYIPAPHSILKNVRVVMPGFCGAIKQGVVEERSYYDVNDVKPISVSYEDAKKEVKTRVEAAVKKEW